MAKIEHHTEDATEREVWRLNDSAFIRIMGILGMLFIAAAIAALIAQIGGGIE